MLGAASNAALVFFQTNKKKSNTYFSSEPQFLLLLALRILLLGVFLSLELALVEPGQVLFARRKVEFDCFGRGDGELAFLVGWAHGCVEGYRN